MNSILFLLLCSPCLGIILKYFFPVFESHNPGVLHVTASNKELPVYLKKKKKKVCAHMKFKVSWLEGCQAHL